MGWLPSKKNPKKIDEFDSLIENHLDGMYRVALRYTREPTLAEDLVHDAVVRALRFRDHFELGTNFKAWIYTVLTHTFIHRYRRQKLEREVLEGTRRADVEAQLRSEESRLMSSKPEQAYLDRLLSDDVVRALDDLPEQYRTVVTLCDLEGLSYREIAEVIDCPVGTVMSRLYRGRRLLEGELYGLAKEQGIVREPVEEREERGDGPVDLQQYKRRQDRRAGGREA